MLLHRDSDPFHRFSQALRTDSQGARGCEAMDPCSRSNHDGQGISPAISGSKGPRDDLQMENPLRIRTMAGSAPSLSTSLSRPFSPVELPELSAERPPVSSSAQVESDYLVNAKTIHRKSLPVWLAWREVQRRSGGEPQQACADLREIRQIAAAEGYPEPSDDIIQKAWRVLDWMWEKEPFEYEIDPFDDGGITIQALHAEIYVCVILSPTEPFQCYVDTDSDSRASIFVDLNELCGPFLEAALIDLRRCLS